MILIFANPFWNHVIEQPQEVIHAHRLVHRRRQAIIFLILVWLMKRFLYKPILDAIERARKGSPPNSPTPRRKRPTPKRNATSFTTRNKTFDKESEALLENATDEAE